MPPMAIPGGDNDIEPASGQRARTPKLRGDDVLEPPGNMVQAASGQKSGGPFEEVRSMGKKKWLLAIAALVLFAIPVNAVWADHGHAWRGCPPVGVRWVCSRCGFAPCRCLHRYYNPYFGAPYGVRFNYYYRYGYPYGYRPSFYFGTFGPRGGFYFGF